MWKINFSAICLYLGLLALVLWGFPNSIRSETAIFLLINAFLTLVLLTLIYLIRDRVLLFVVYVPFFIAYIVKAIFQYFDGFNTNYVIATLRTSISTEGYISSLFVVTVSHVLIVIFLTVNGISSSRHIGYYTFSSTHQYLKRNVTLLVIISFILISSAIMYYYGVAIMGTSGVSLPFKMSGVLFYTRTIVIPLLLLLLVQMAYLDGEQSLLKKAITLMLILALSEILVRATKAPLFLVVIQLLVLHCLLQQSGAATRSVISRKLLIGTGLAALALWPLIEIYRSVVVTQASDGKAVSFFSNAIDFEYVFYIIRRFFQRMLGFLQLAGILTNPVEEDDILHQMVSFGSIASYYTQNYLGYRQPGHLSSPSLLGFFVLVHDTFWPIFLVAYLAVISFFWRCAGLLKEMANPIKCFIAVGIINSILAGTIDFFIKGMIFVFAVAISLYFLQRIFNQLCRVLSANN